ncbi:MAG: hypothetical protein A3I24_01170 [Candidatus Harrisonbacteria bacterium RIFCSPLOWO2_02_FULL_41_13b]|uniref:ABC transmembrane type-1 domain-containing protein n=1 Tax=Candidatus Harrisonbacteria bacterium RIFCSPLOWO2_02_FULL_41_13b TaxID=1798409 RepID=A0A1G1ZS24_9BACT|nr:MAG: hypothetical protein A3J53_03100 [Candidatus Harrisonbacteria bacterium RIFCSPHIGHO2_02_FULL_40_20]OGY67269.1 MAG: hypothetical protein A3I24_01170 [Candidatus Harrisonbacteria bacterium RIFCSPLOWO2_02_FULL_41_13b]
MSPIFKTKILWRIYVIWFFRRVLPLVSAQILIIAFALKIFAKKVFLGKVLENAAVAADSSYWEFLKYLAYAFFSAHILIQIIIILILALGTLLLRDAGRVIRTYINTIR